jgi:hypothetical protein
MSNTVCTCQYSDLEKRARCAHLETVVLIHGHIGIAEVTDLSCKKEIEENGNTSALRYGCDLFQAGFITLKSQLHVPLFQDR